MGKDKQVNIPAVQQIHKRFLRSKSAIYEKAFDFIFHRFNLECKTRILEVFTLCDLCASASSALNSSHDQRNAEDAEAQRSRRRAETVM
jgi:hypothetical protein